MRRTNDPDRKEEKGDDFLARMWSTYFDRDKELPKEQMVPSDDLARLVEGYHFWQQSINDPDRQRAYDIIRKAAASIEAHNRSSGERTDDPSQN